MAEIPGDIRLRHELNDPSCLPAEIETGLARDSPVSLQESLQELNDSSYPPEMEAGLTRDSPVSPQGLDDSSYSQETAVAPSLTRNASTKLLHPIHGTSGQYSLWDKLRRSPSIERRFSAATQTQSVRDRSLSTRCSVSSGNSRHIRHSSDSSELSADSHQEEDIVPSSLKPHPLEFNKVLPASPQRKAPNLNKPSPSLPVSATTQRLPITTSPSNQFPGWNYVHHMSSEPSVSHSDARTLEDTGMDMLPYTVQTVHETDGKSNNQCELCLTISHSPSIEITENRGLAKNLSAEDQSHPADPNHPIAFWNTVSSSTPASTAKPPTPDVLPSWPPTLGSSLPLSNIFPLTDSIAINDFPTSNVVSPVSDFKIIEPYEAGASNWVYLNSWPLEPATTPINHMRSDFQTTNSDLPNQLRVSNGATPFVAFGARWVGHNVATVPYLQRKESFGLSDSIVLNGIDEQLESEIQSPMIKSILNQLGASETSNPGFLPHGSCVPLTLGIRKEYSFSDGSVDNVIADAPVPLSASEMNYHDQKLWNLSSPVGSSDQRSPSAEPTHRCPALNQIITQWPIREGHQLDDNTSGSTKNFFSHDNLFHLCNVLEIPSSTKRQPHCFEHSTLLVSHSPSEKTLFGELRGLVSVVNSAWMDKLSSVPYLWQRSKALSPDALLKNGIDTLKGLLCGRLAKTFEELFALVHLAFATAFFLHRQQGFFCWNTFYNDTFQWQHTLASHEDRVAFLAVMKPELWPLPPLYRNRLASLYDVSSRESAYCGDKQSLLGVLRTSQLLKVCIGFLDCRSILR